MKISNTQNLNFGAVLGERRIHTLFSLNNKMQVKATQIIHPFKNETISEKRKEELEDRFTKELEQAIDPEATIKKTEVIFKEELPFSKEEFISACRKPAIFRDKKINDFIQNKCGKLTRTYRSMLSDNFPFFGPRGNYTTSKVDCIV